MPKKASPQIAKHTRVSDTPILRLEKIALRWLVARVPRQMTPDHLTAIGVLGSMIIFAGYVLTTYDKGYLWLASLGFVINWFGDSLDGTLARFRSIERPRYGFYIDHIVDAFSEVFMFVGMGLSPYLRFDIALIALITYLLASIYVYISTYVNGVFRISYGGVSPTEVRLTAILANTIVFFVGNPVVKIPILGLDISPLTFYDLAVVGVIVTILGLLVYNAILTGKKLAHEDQSKSPVKSS